MSPKPNALPLLSVGTHRLFTIGKEKEETTFQEMQEDVFPDLPSPSQPGGSGLSGADIQKGQDDRPEPAPVDGAQVKDLFDDLANAPLEDDSSDDGFPNGEDRPEPILANSAQVKDLFDDLANGPLEEDSSGDEETGPDEGETGAGMSSGVEWDQDDNADDAVQPGETRDQSTSGDPIQEAIVTKLAELEARIVKPKIPEGCNLTCKPSPCN
jgi:hypothetical protein